MKKDLSKKELEEAINEALDNDKLVLKSITQVNHDPHPYMIGPRHVKHASENHSGMLGTATLEAIPCAMQGCGLGYSEHKFDTVGFLQLRRNVTQEEFKPEADKIVEILKENGGEIDGFTFVETDEKFRIGNPEK